MRRLTKEDFVKKSVEIYDDLYDYSRVSYLNSKTVVSIFCKKCEKYFEQTPNEHLRRRKINCDCSNKLNTEKFIKRANSLYGNLYDYKNLIYVDTYTKVEIICKKCNLSFWQMPHNHLNGTKCPSCFGTHRKSNDDFINEAITIHKGRYDYSQVEYKNNGTKVKIFCKSCNNFFTQIPRDHLKGTGCPSCCGGFNPNLPAILYYIKIEKYDNILYKVGITNRTVHKRFGSDMKYIKIVNIEHYEIGKDAYDNEKEILNKYKGLRYSGIPVLKNGNSEIFIEDILDLDK